MPSLHPSTTTLGPVPRSTNRAILGNRRITGWTCGDNASIKEFFIRLTPDRQSKSGYCWSDTPLNSNKWVTTFKFRISGQVASMNVVNILGRVPLWRRNDLLLYQSKVARIGRRDRQFSRVGRTARIIGRVRRFRRQSGDVQESERLLFASQSSLVRGVPP